ncbi:hypothetical protein U9M48_013383 [Paspalum notatum var. saurae]|uniref:Reverse transcriptase Ty1/copia-type domain-containing protein n=1 Tax=Paspalum notatum var. saurae TaxID=547442 RepID=A0AAQ3WJD2_PASNO
MGDEELGVGDEGLAEEAITIELDRCYRHIVGSLVYLGVTRPDILYSVHILSQFVSAPTQLHYIHLLRVLRYLRGTMSRRLFFPRSSSLQLQAYCDATWASDSSNRRSLSAYCVFLGGSLIAWKTKKRTAVSRSSTEVELRAMALVTAEVTWLRWLLADFGVSVSIPTPTDSTGAISIARDPVKHELTKHISVDAYYTRAQVEDGVVTLRYVPSELQLADFFTKTQTRAQHSFYLSKLAVSERPFDLIHSDVSSPFVSKGGHKYCITSIDDFSHHTEVLPIYKNFSAMVRSHFDTSIRVKTFLMPFVKSFLRKVLLLSFLVLVLQLRTVLVNASIIFFLRLLVLLCLLLLLLRPPSSPPIFGLRQSTHIYNIQTMTTFIFPIVFSMCFLHLEHNRDYDDTFAPVAHMTGVRTSCNGVYSALSRLFVLDFSIWPVVSALHTSSNVCSLLLYVDGMIINGDDPQCIAFVKARLGEQFLMSDLGPLHYFLRIEVSSAPHRFYLSQEKYIQSFLNRASLTYHRAVETPMELNLHLCATNGEPLDDPTHYRHIIGSLAYLGVTRRDISYSMHTLSQFVCAPCSSTIVIFSGSYVVFVGICNVICPFHALAL